MIESPEPFACSPSTGIAGDCISLPDAEFSHVQIAGDCTTARPAATIAATLLQLALTYARLGYYPLPLAPKDKYPIPSLTPHGYKDATRDEAQLRAWWQNEPEANIGFNLQMSGLIDISSDCPEWQQRFEELGLPPTFSYSSGNGRHHLYRLPLGGPIARDCVPGQYDLMSEGNAVAPGSVHPSGREYTALTPPVPVEDLPLAPAWAIEWLQSHVNGARKEHTPEEWAELPSGATLAHSRRFQALCRANAQLRAVCAGEAVVLTTKSGAKDGSPSIQRAVFVNQLLRARYPHNEIRALARHFSGVLESRPKWFEVDIDNLLNRYTPENYAPESTGVVAQMAPRGGRHYEITAGELLDRYHQHADCGARGIILDWTVADAAARLGVSTGSIKRREAELVEAGHIRREYGYVILEPAEIGSQPMQMQEIAAFARHGTIEQMIGSQFGPAHDDAPNEPEEPVCIKDRACAERTHPPAEPGPGASYDEREAEAWAAAWQEADQILAEWQAEPPRWQRVVEAHQRGLSRVRPTSGLGQAQPSQGECVLSAPAGAPCATRGLVARLKQRQQGANDGLTTAVAATKRVRDHHRPAALGP